MSKKHKTEDRPLLELASVCLDGLMAEVIWIGPDQPLQYAVFESGKTDVRPSVSLRGRQIVSPRDRSGLVSKGVVLLPSKPVPYGTTETPTRPDGRFHLSLLRSAKTPNGQTGGGDERNQSQ